MKRHLELLKIIDLLKALDPESVKLGIKLFKQSSFMDQFRGNLSCLGFIFVNEINQIVYLSYKDLCSCLKHNSYILERFVNNKYKACLTIKNNRLW